MPHSTAVARLERPDAAHVVQCMSVFRGCVEGAVQRASRLGDVPNMSSIVCRDSKDV